MLTGCDNHIEAPKITFHLEQNGSLKKEKNIGHEPISRNLLQPIKRHLLYTLHMLDLGIYSQKDYSITFKMNSFV
jgi:hypothetical protein